MTTPNTLYEHDLEGWTRVQIDLLRQGNTQNLDIKNLIMELEDLGKSSLHELESCFIVLIAHLLKWQFQLDTLAGQWKEFEGKSGRKTIIEQRTQLSFLLDKVPSIKASLELARDEAYPAARRLTIKETGMPSESFPSVCPYSVNELLDEDFYPGNLQ